MLHEEEEQVEFFAGERHLLALQEDLTGFRTDIEVADIEALFCLCLLYTSDAADESVPV